MLLLCAIDGSLNIIEESTASNMDDSEYILMNDNNIELVEVSQEEASADERPTGELFKSNLLCSMRSYFQS